MKRFVTVVSGLAGALLLLGPMVKEAAAIDPTGTWTGTAATTCSGFVSATASAPPGGIKTTIKISPAVSPATGFNISVELTAANLNSDLNGPHLYHGELFQKTGKKPAKSAHLAVAGCTTTAGSGDLLGTVGHFVVGPSKTTPTVVELKGTLISEDDIPSALECSFKGLTLDPTAPGDPKIGPCSP